EQASTTPASYAAGLPAPSSRAPPLPYFDSPEYRKRRRPCRNRPGATTPKPARPASTRRAKDARVEPTRRLCQPHNLDAVEGCTTTMQPGREQVPTITSRPVDACRPEKP